MLTTGSAGYENVLWLPVLLVLFVRVARSFSAAALVAAVMLRRFARFVAGAADRAAI